METSFDKVYYFSLLSSFNNTLISIIYHQLKLSIEINRPIYMNEDCFFYIKSIWKTSTCLDTIESISFEELDELEELDMNDENTKNRVYLLKKEDEEQIMIEEYQQYETKQYEQIHMLIEMIESKKFCHFINFISMNENDLFENINGNELKHQIPTHIELSDGQTISLEDFIEKFNDSQLFINVLQTFHLDLNILQLSLHSN